MGAPARLPSDVRIREHDTDAAPVDREAGSRAKKTRISVESRGSRNWGVGQDHSMMRPASAQPLVCEERVNDNKDDVRCTTMHCNNKHISAYMPPAVDHPECSPHRTTARTKPLNSARSVRRERRERGRASVERTRGAEPKFPAFDATGCADADANPPPPRAPPLPVNPPPPPAFG